MNRPIDWKRSWWRIFFLPLRVFFLFTSYFILTPLAKLFETIGSYIPGLEQK